ncbi:MAG TPA: hypothetical protein VL463_03985 [Kofleriaceae bacterium]|nr:hypothetical protein [Kofleriaceae bacterium]
MRRFGVICVLLAIASTAHADTSQAKDFIDDAKLFYRVVACGSNDPLPAGFDQKIVDAHCKEMLEREETFRTKYTTPAGAFFATLRPANLPTTVVYPFGGGDLVGALVVYPDAREITTLSLEHPGDPTRLAGLDKKHLKSSLALFRDVVKGLLVNNDSATENMLKLEKGPIPGQLGFFITGLAVMGYEPVSLKYFTIDPTGAVVYLTEADIAAKADTKAKKIKGKWVDTDYSQAFDNMELTFRKKGDPTAPLIVHRHIAANLADDKLEHSPLAAYLESRGKIVAMTKAASYLLWFSGFGVIRDYLLDHMQWMVSDSTGIPPRYAKKKGFTQTTYGTFEGAYLDDASADVAETFVDLWKSQKHRKLPFRFGYPDSAGNVHMMITAPKEPK